MICVGFVYTGSFTLIPPGGKTQYVAPLMADFQPSQSSIYCLSTGRMLLDYYSTAVLFQLLSFFSVNMITHEPLHIA